jgi:hypothetical protein
VRTAHALAKPKTKGDPTNDAHARQVADAIRAATLGATSAQDFMARAKAVPHPADVEIVAQELPAITAAGDIVDGGGAMDPSFSRAANQLANPGDVSPVVESERFGWHVIYLKERVPEQRMALEDRRIAFAQEIYGQRARAALDALVQRRRSTLPIAVLPPAERLMRSLSIGRDGQRGGQAGALGDGDGDGDGHAP